jgi:uncharacterized protein YbjT (DUF2867 family)
VRVVVFGATGDQGLPQLQALRAARHTAVAASRAGVSELDGLEGVAADFGNLPSLVEAMAGCEAVFATFPSSSFNPKAPLIDGARALGVAARRAGVQRIVFNTSLLVRDEPLGFAAHDTRLLMKQAMREAGVPVTCIQPVIYMDNLLRPWALPTLQAEDVLEYAHDPALEVSWICAEDTAALMVAALARPATAGRDYTVGGQQVLRLPELAAALSAVLGRPLGWRSLPIPDFCERMRQLFKGSGLDEAVLVGELSRIYEWYNTAPEKPFKVDMRPVLSELPVHLTPFSEWAARQRWR